MKSKTVFLALALALVSFVSMGFFSQSQAAQVGNEIFCQLSGDPFLAKTFSPNQLYTCRMPSSKVQSGETLSLDIAVTGLELVTVTNPTFCTQIPRLGVGMTVECTNDSQTNPIETVDLQMQINSSTGPEGSIVVTGHLKDDPSTLATTKYTAVFDQVPTSTMISETQSPFVPLKGSALQANTTVAVDSTLQSTVQPTESSFPMMTVALIVLALLGIGIGGYFAFRKPTMTEPLVVPTEPPTSLTPEPLTPPTPPTPEPLTPPTPPEPLTPPTPSEPSKV